MTNNMTIRAITPTPEQLEQLRAVRAVADEMNVDAACAFWDRRNRYRQIAEDYAERRALQAIEEGEREMNNKLARALAGVRNALRETPESELDAPVLRAAFLPEPREVSPRPAVAPSPLLLLSSSPGGRRPSLSTAPRRRRLRRLHAYA